MNAIHSSYPTLSLNEGHIRSSQFSVSRLSKLLAIAFSIFGAKQIGVEASNLDSTEKLLQDKFVCKMNSNSEMRSPSDLLADECYQYIKDDNQMMESKEFFTEEHLKEYHTLYQCTKEATQKGLSKRGLFAEKGALHDLDSDALLEDYFQQFPQDKKIGIMGGSNLDRNTEGYKDVALIAKQLAENGNVIITGGGPGAMEAAHLGAWFAFRSNDELEEAILSLSAEPKYAEHKWLSTAQRVMEAYPRLINGIDVAIPTFVYGQRPPTPFASNLVTYLRESVREEAILLSSTGAIVFTPGSEGTDEEVASAIKHKAYRGPVYNQRPLILYNSEHWKEKFASKILKKAHLADSIEEVFQLIKTP